MSTMNQLKFLGGLVLEIGAVIAVLAIIPGLGGSEALRFSNAGFNANSSLPANSFATNSVAQTSLPNEVFFDGQSSRVLDNPNQDRSRPRSAWINDLVPPPPVAQQRYVEEMLDHNSQRALDAAARVWNQGDGLLPPELRVRPQPATENLAANYDRGPKSAYSQQPANLQQQSAYSQQQSAGEPIRDLGTRRRVPEYRTEEYRPNQFGHSDEIVPEYVVPPTTAERDYGRPSHYAPMPNPAPSRYAPPSNPLPNGSLPSNSPQRYSVQERPRRMDQRY